MILLSSLMVLVAGVTVVSCVTAVACIQTVAFLLLLASFKFLMVSCNWSALADFPGVTNAVVGVSAIPFEHAAAGSHAVDGVVVARPC